MHVLLIEHDDVEQLYPFTATHCSWELRLGVFTIAERWQHALPEMSVSVHTHRSLHLAGFLERQRVVGNFHVQPTLVMAGHVALSPTVMLQLAEHCRASDQPIIVYCGGAAVGAYLPNPVEDPSSLRIHLDTLDADTCATVEVQGHVLHRLWHAFDHLAEAIQWDAALIPHAISPLADVHPTAVIDTTHGPVLIGDGAVVRAYTVLTGPVAIGAHSVLQPFTMVTSTAIGPMVMLGGEVSMSIVQGYANKVHDGFLGHSYLNEWTNLGAGTITSNLKNTYGHIRVELPWGREDTQRTFVGLLLGAHSKSGIGTLFSTGTVAGACANIVSDQPLPRQIPSLWWGPSQALYRIDDAINVARTVMARRDQELGPAMEAVLRSLAHS